jgi:hypothetical protein
VIDLFEFIRASVQVVLHDLPLGEYKRAVYLIDLSKVCDVHGIANSRLSLDPSHNMRPRSKHFS